MMEMYGLAAAHLQHMRLRNGVQWDEEDAVWFRPEYHRPTGSPTATGARPPATGTATGARGRE